MPRRVVREFATALNGWVLVPGDRGWPEVNAVWNGRVVRAPAMAVRPASTSDVAAVIDLARQRRLLLSVKGGGHNLAGTALAEGALTLDMSGMRNVAVDVAGRRVQVGPGCRLGEVDRVTQRHGLATVLGLVSETGVAGLTLGGGFGYLTRAGSVGRSTTWSRSRSSPPTVGSAPRIAAPNLTCSGRSGAAAGMWA